ncbi:MAG TPA: hypothetical protein VFV49_09310 [Thermoanaerobaculia bacterium]|nr:hypothetical protein [Thermoanaerobaculia bacterium]
MNVEITRWVDDHQPGFVEFRLVDAFGVSHYFVEKVPIISSASLTRDDDYPRRGELDCTLIAPPSLQDGVSVVTIDTTEPWDVTAVNGQSRFVVDAREVFL